MDDVVTMEEGNVVTLTELHHVKLGVGEDGSSAEPSTGPHQKDVAEADGLAVAGPCGVDNNVVSIKSDEANTEEHIVQYSDSHQS